MKQTRPKDKLSPQAKDLLALYEINDFETGAPKCRELLWLVDDDVDDNPSYWSAADPRIPILRSALEEIASKARREALKLLARVSSKTPHRRAEKLAAAGEMLGFSSEDDLQIKLGSKIKDKKLREMKLGGRSETLTARKKRAIIWTGNANVRDAERSRFEWFRVLADELCVYFDAQAPDGDEDEDDASQAQIETEHEWFEPNQSDLEWVDHEWPAHDSNDLGLPEQDEQPEQTQQSEQSDLTDFEAACLALKERRRIVWLVARLYRLPHEAKYLRRLVIALTTIAFFVTLWLAQAAFLFIYYTITGRLHISQ